jgi:hypothetical protein
MTNKPKDWRQATIEAVKKMTPEQARQSLTDAGIYTKTGRLRRKYITPHK